MRWTREWARSCLIALKLMRGGWTVGKTGLVTREMLTEIQCSYKYITFSALIIGLSYFIRKSFCCATEPWHQINTNIATLFTIPGLSPCRAIATFYHWWESLEESNYWPDEGLSIIPLYNRVCKYTGAMQWHSQGIQESLFTMSRAVICSSQDMTGLVQSLEYSLPSKKFHDPNQSSATL